jgi:co-chaperonin GroES (HSP10)
MEERDYGYEVVDVIKRRVTMQLKAIGDNLYVKVLPKNNKTESGLIIIKKGKEWAQDSVYAEVLVKGKDVVDEIKVGDLLIVRGHAGIHVDEAMHPDDPDTHRIIQESEVLAICEMTEEEKELYLSLKKEANEVGA